MGEGVGLITTTWAIDFSCWREQVVLCLLLCLPTILPVCAEALLLVAETAGRVKLLTNLWSGMNAFYAFVIYNLWIRDFYIFLPIKLLVWSIFIYVYFKDNMNTLFHLNIKKMRKCFRVMLQKWMKDVSCALCMKIQGWEIYENCIWH